MLSHYPHVKHSKAVFARRDNAQRRDVTWGRVLFPPPELANPQVIFDPIPFRDQHLSPKQARK